MEYSKGYIVRWKRREKPEADTTDYWFDSRPEKAAYWETKEEAENDCVLFERHPIVLTLSGGSTHTCTGFRVEQRAPKEFVIFCLAPFKTRARGQVVRP